MAIEYTGKAKIFKEREIECANYFVGIGDIYVSHTGRKYECVRNSLSGEMDVMCRFWEPGQRGQCWIPKILFFVDSLSFVEE